MVLQSFINKPTAITPIHEIGTVVYLANEKSELGYIVISDEIGISKPDYKIFEYALNKVNYTGIKDRVIMIGDSLTADIQGGINYGIKTCWVNLFDKENNINIKPTYEVNNLYDLKDIL